MPKGISSRLADYFHRFEDVTDSNSRVSVLRRAETGLIMSRLYLYDSEIARRVGPMVSINVQGWPNQTTLDRLSAVLAPVGGRVWRQSHQLYWSGPLSTSQADLLPSRGWVLVASGTALEELAYLDLREEMTNE